MDTTSLNGAKVLVIGASSFIGSHLVPALKETGALIFTANRSAKPFPDQDIEHQIMDITDLTSVGETIGKIRPDYIYNLSGHVQGGRELGNVWPTFKTNLEGTVNLLMVAQRHPCKRLIITGSLDEYQLKIEETCPVSPYAASKIAASNYARMFHSLYDLPVVIVRPYMVYGPNQKDHNKLVPFTILSLLKGETPSFSSGVREADWVYIEDVVEALITSVVYPDLEGETVQVGTGKLHSVKKVVHTIYDLMQVSGQPQFGTIPDRVHETVVLADVDETKRRIGWEAKTDLQDGLESTVEWYKKNRNIDE